MADIEIKLSGNPIKPIKNSSTISKSWNNDLFSEDSEVELWRENDKRNEAQNEIEQGIRHGQNKLTNEQIKQGFRYNNKGEIVMPPQVAKEKGYSFINTVDGKTVLVDKNYNVLINDVQQQDNLRDWISSNNLWAKPKTLTEAGNFEHIRNPKGYAEIHDAFESAGNFTAAVAAGLILSPILLEGAASFAPQAFKLVTQASKYAGQIAKQVASYAKKYGIKASQWFKGQSTWDKVQMGVDAFSLLGDGIGLLADSDNEVLQRIASGLSVWSSVASLFPSKYKAFHMFAQNLPDVGLDFKSLVDDFSTKNVVHLLLDLGSGVTLNKFRGDDILSVISATDDGYNAVTGGDIFDDTEDAVKEGKRVLKGLGVSQEAVDEVKKQIQASKSNNYKNGGLIRRIK